MATDLHARAVAQQGLLAADAAALTDALAAAREELQRRHPDPDSVVPEDWAADLGATQHQEVGRSALNEAKTSEAAVRAQLAVIANPADAATFEDQLRDLLVEEAALRVQLRLADERVTSLGARVAALAVLSGRAEAEVAAAGARTQWAEQHTATATQLRSGLTSPPLDTIVADATALLGGAAFNAADDRLNDLLPTELRARAEQRAGEAAAVVEAAEDAEQRTRDEADTLAAAADALQGPIVSAQRALLDAERALAAYEGGAAGRTAWATGVLDAVAQLPDLSTEQAAALDPATHAVAVAAAAAEADLAAAVADVADAQRAVDDAILDAFLDDPDVDPDTVQAVIDAKDALNDAGIQDPLNDARAAYDQAARDALDAWEVEVPPVLWAALDDFVEARRVLRDLGSAADRTALTDALDDAEDTLAAALDARDVASRAGWALGLIAADRAGTLAAATASMGDRRRQYLQGDGPSGRVPSEL